MTRAARLVAAAVATAAALAFLVFVVLPGRSHQALGRGQPTREVGSLPLPRGGAWYSEALDTSAASALTSAHRPIRVLVRKWVTWQGNECVSLPGGRATIICGMTGDGEPGFGDWDALDVHTLPDTVAGVLRLLKSGRLKAGQMDRAENSSPLIWLAQLAAMLADDANTPAARTAAFRAIETFPGLERLGRVRDPQGRLGIGVAEQAGNLHPLDIAAGPGCTSPYGGAGCLSVAEPPGRYELEMIFDPRSHAVLAVRTIALSAIPAAQIKAGTALYQVSYRQGKVVAHPAIPPPSLRSLPSIQSVTWHLARVTGRRVAVYWGSGTCDASLAPKPRLSIAQTLTTVTLRVLVHVVTESRNMGCAGVGLGGTLSTTLAHPVGHRQIAHGKVTDREQ